MKFNRLVLVLQAALLPVCFAGAARADDTDAARAKIPPYSKAALQSKIEYCQTCHGASGEGARGTVPIPRLAGQQAKYIENQLRNFVVHRRHNNVMSNAVQQMGSAEMVALGAYFHDLNPKPVGGAPKELADEGKKIFEAGVPEANVPACASCHGADAKGAGVVPRLAGQLNDYAIKKLMNFEKERGADPAVPAETRDAMKSVSHNLNEAQVHAIAAYVSYLE
jgi:cytochrome c553